MNWKKVFISFLYNRQARKDNFLLDNWANIRSILVRPMGFSIGDATVHTAHLRQLKTVFPYAKIGVLIPNERQGIYKSSGLVDEFVERSFLGHLKNRKKWDLLLDFENNFNTSCLFADQILMPKWLVVFKKNYKKYYNFDTIKSYDLHCNQKEDAPLSHYLSNSIFADYFSLPKPYSVIQSKEIEQRKVDKLWEEGRFRLLLCPQGSSRQIPPEELATLLNRSLTENLLSRVECILGYTSTSYDYLIKLKELCPHIRIKASPKTTLDEFLALVESAQLVIAVDGGSLHLACAFRKPLLSFYANSYPNLGIWEPLVAPGVPHLKIVSSHQQSNDNSDTRDFPMDEAIPWLNQQIKELD